MLQVSWGRRGPDLISKKVTVEGVADSEAVFVRHVWGVHELELVCKGIRLI